MSHLKPVPDPEPSTRPGTEPSIAELERYATILRINCVRMLAVAKSGHLDSSLSAADIVAALYFRELRHDPSDPDWPERDLDESRAEEPAAGWSDDPYRWEPPPPTKPDDSLEGDWSDSEPFETEPPESDPFAPAATPPQDDPWAFPPRSEPEPTYEPASTEPDFVSQPASW